FDDEPRLAVFEPAVGGEVLHFRSGAAGIGHGANKNEERNDTESGNLHILKRFRTERPKRGGRRWRSVETGERVDRSAKPRSADFQSAVSPSCTRQSVRTFVRSRIVERAADYKSAIQQSAT